MENLNDVLENQKNDLLNDIKNADETIILSNDVIRKLKDDIQRLKDVGYKVSEVDEVGKVELGFNEKYPTLTKALSLMTINQLTNATTKTDLESVYSGQPKNKIYFVESVLTTILRKGNKEKNVSIDFVCEDRHKLSTETRKHIEDNPSQYWSELLLMFIESYL